MVSYKDPIIAKEIITDRYKNPRHKGLKGYGSHNRNKESCIDDIDVEMKVEDNKVVDVNWDGIGCAICSSSTDLFAEKLVGLSVDDANKLIDEYKAMLEGKEELNEELLDELIIFKGVAQHVSRIGCATLGPLGYKDILNMKK